TFETLGISKRGFWEIDTTTLDIDMHYSTVIEKVINFGTWDDYIKTIRYYGPDTFLKIGQTSPNIRQEKLHLVNMIHMAYAH
ncbi:MAG: hypothetical protein KJ607_04980, partial [Bacteroidetes bacterium]|nr:hypothetical protein [Bacteroidota bacterium]